MSGLTVFPPPGGFCQPPSIRPSYDDGSRPLSQLGLDDWDVRSLAIWLRTHHPESFEAALRHISEDRPLTRGVDR